MDAHIWLRIASFLGADHIAPLLLSGTSIARALRPLTSIYAEMTPRNICKRDYVTLFRYVWRVPFARMELAYLAAKFGAQGCIAFARAHSDDSDDVTPIMHIGFIAHDDVENSLVALRDDYQTYACIVTALKHNSFHVIAWLAHHTYHRLARGMLQLMMRRAKKIDMSIFDDVPSEVRFPLESLDAFERDDVRGAEDFAREHNVDALSVLRFALYHGATRIAHSIKVNTNNIESVDAIYASKGGNIDCFDLVAPYYNEASLDILVREAILGQQIREDDGFVLSHNGGGAILRRIVECGYELNDENARTITELCMSARNEEALRALLDLAPQMKNEIVRWAFAYDKERAPKIVSRATGERMCGAIGGKTITPAFVRDVMMI